MSTTMLREVVRTHPDELFRLVAGAAMGDAEGVEFTRKVLGIENLSASRPRIIGPVPECVEALAALDPAALGKIAKLWTPPPSDGHDYSVKAWRFALRHLKGAGVLRRDEVPGHPQLDREADIVWAVSAEPISWQQVKNDLEVLPFFGERVLRTAAIRRLADPFPIRDDILSAPSAMIRLLRGKCHLLDASSARLLLETAKLCVTAPLNQDPLVITFKDGKPVFPIFSAMNFQGCIGAARVFELCREISPDSCEAFLASLIPQIHTLLDWELGRGMNSLFVLSTQWETP